MLNVGKKRAEERQEKEIKEKGNITGDRTRLSQEQMRNGLKSKDMHY